MMTPTPKPAKIAISLRILILWPSEDSKIMVVDTWKNMPIAIANNHESETSKLAITTSLLFILLIVTANSELSHLFNTIKYILEQKNS